MADLKPLILIVDDDLAICQTVKTLLESSKRFEVIYETVAEEGLKTIFRRKPDVIILDVLMPGTDGLSVIKRVKENSQTSHIPVMFLTGDEREETMEEALASYADMYLKKPVTKQVLVQKMDFLLSVRKPA